MNNTLDNILKEAKEIRKELKLLSLRMDQICLVIGKATMMYELADSWQLEKTLELYKNEYLDIHLRIKDLRIRLKDSRQMEEFYK
jgi:hypothetical protein